MRDLVMLPLSVPQNPKDRLSAFTPAGLERRGLPLWRLMIQVITTVYRMRVKAGQSPKLTSVQMRALARECADIAMANWSKAAVAGAIQKAFDDA